MDHTIGVSIYRPSGKIKGVVQIVHGMAEHRKRYEDFAQFLKSHGYAVVSFDLPGHGESIEDGLKGYFGEKDGWDHLLYITHEITSRIHKEFEDKPIILLGHSMGSMIARCYIQKYDEDIDALVLTGVPNYQAAAKGGIVLGNILKIFKGGTGHSHLMDSLLTGSFSKAIDNPKTPLDWLSYSEKNIEDYIKDEYCGFPFTIQGYIDELTGLERMHDVRRYETKNPNLPILMLAGEDDPCRGNDAGFEDSLKTLQDAKYTNIKTKLYSNMRHEILNEKDHKEVYNDILKFLNNVVKE